MSQLDCVLCSNYESMDALPYLVSDPEFRGRVFCTDPTARFGELLMQIHVKNSGISAVGSGIRAKSDLPPSGMTPRPGSCLRLPYSDRDIKQCMARIERLTYGQQLRTAGWSPGDLYITPRSSGAAIGAAVWLISGAAPSDGDQQSISASMQRASREKATAPQPPSRASSSPTGKSGGQLSAGPSDAEVSTTGPLHRPPEADVGDPSPKPRRSPPPIRMAYIAAASALHARHPTPLDTQGLFNADVLIMQNVAVSTRKKESPAGNTAGANLIRFCRQVWSALNSGRRVLVPVMPNGVLVDILEYLPKSLESGAAARATDDSAAESVKLKKRVRRRVRIAVATAELARAVGFSSAAPEWLNSRRATRGLRGDGLFSFTWQLRPVPNSPHLVLSTTTHMDAGIPGDPRGAADGTLGGADVVFFPATLTDAGIPDRIPGLVGGSRPSVTLACDPRAGAAVRAAGVPIETHLDVKQAGSLLRQLKPRHLVIHSALNEAADWKTSGGCPVTALHPLRPVQVPLGIPRGTPRYYPRNANLRSAAFVDGSIAADLIKATRQVGKKRFRVEGRELIRSAPLRAHAALGDGQWTLSTVNPNQLTRGAKRPKKSETTTGEVENAPNLSSARGVFGRSRGSDILVPRLCGGVDAKRFAAELRHMGLLDVEVKTGGGSPDSAEDGPCSVVHVPSMSAQVEFDASGHRTHIVARDPQTRDSLKRALVRLLRKL